jgi:TRAP-type C4-dicarboxylate transport system permease small subunit
MNTAPTPVQAGAAPASAWRRWQGWQRWQRWDETLAGAALALMTLIPLLELALRPLLGRGVENAPVLVQHLGLLLAMAGALAAERHGHLTTLGSSLGQLGGTALRTVMQAALRVLAQGGAALVCGLLALASWRFVASEVEAPRRWPTASRCGGCRRRCRSALRCWACASWARAAPTTARPLHAGAGCRRCCCRHWVRRWGRASTAAPRRWARWSPACC